MYLNIYYTLNISKEDNNNIRQDSSVYYMLYEDAIYTLLYVSSLYYNDAQKVIYKSR